MLILLSNPALSVIFIILAVLLFLSNNNRYGIALKYKGCQQLLKKYGDDLYIIDIRNNKKYAELHVTGSQHLGKPIGEIGKTRKLLIIHDSDVDLNKYHTLCKLEQFSDHIYQTNMIDHDLKGYDFSDDGIANGKDLSAVMKNKLSA